MNDTTPPPLSGSCAACGARVENAEPCVYISAGKAERYLYILCPLCYEEVQQDKPREEAVLAAVEQRCLYGRAVRA